MGLDVELEVAWKSVVGGESSDCDCEAEAEESEVCGEGKGNESCIWELCCQEEVLLARTVDEIGGPCGVEAEDRDRSLEEICDEERTLSLFEKRDGFSEREGHSRVPCELLMGCVPLGSGNCSPVAGKPSGCDSSGELARNLSGLPERGDWNPSRAYRAASIFSPSLLFSSSILSCQTAWLALISSPANIIPGRMSATASNSGLAKMFMNPI